MSGRIETFTTDAESSKWSRNKDINVVEAGVDIGDKSGTGGSDVSVDQVITEGREVAGITVDGERTAILIPNSGEWTQSDWAEDDPADDAYIKNKPELANVATSGSYTDLSDAPDLSDYVQDANYVHTDYNYDLGAKSIVDNVTTDLAGKVDKVQGKSLTDNNYSNADKTKVGNLADIYGVGSGLDLSNNVLSSTVPVITVDSALSNSSENPVQNKIIAGALADKVDKVSGKVLSDNNYTTAEKDKLAGIDNGAEVNDISTISVNGTRVNPDANKNVDISISYTDLTNKPTLGTAAAKDIPASGDAASTEVVMGDDSRLTDSRNAADVYSWAKASSKPSYTASEVGAIPATDKGANNGVAELDSAGKVLSSQLPSYVDDVLEYSSTSYFPVTGESGKIYIAIDTNLSYRWTGSGYAEISPSIALGETSSTAYRGDRGKIAYDHSQLTSGNPHNVTKSDVGLGNVGNFKAVSTVASQGLSSTEQANARANIGAGTSSFSGSYNDLSNKPTIPSKTSDLTNDSGFVTANNRKSFYGTCSTAAATAAKEVTLSDTSGWELKAGTIVGVRFSNTNTASNVTLNVNGSGAKSIYYNNSVYTSNNADYTGYANRTFFYMYDGTYWVWINESVLYYDTKPSAYIDSAGGTQNKGAQCTNYSLVDNSYIQVINIYANTYAGAITLNINGRGAKPIYINGSASSSTNYTLPAGSYFVYYDGTNYYFRTDGKLTGTGIVDIGGNTAKFLRGDGTWQTPTDTNNRKSFYGTCSTAAATAAKEVTLSDTTGWELKAGTIVGVKFTNSNTASNVTLNVNGTGAKSIYYGAGVYTGDNQFITGTADKITYYMYDGTNWAYIILGSVSDVNNVAQYVSTTAADYPVLLSRSSSSNISTTVKSVNFTFNPNSQNLTVPKINGIVIGDGTVRYDKTTEKLQFYDNGTWVDLLTIHTAIKAYIGFCSSGTSSSGTFTTYFVDLSYDPVNNTLNFVKLNASDSYTMNTHTTHSFSSDISTTYGAEVFGYNAQSTPYNSYYKLSADCYCKGLNLSASNDISSIASALFPLDFSTMTSQTSGASWNCNSSSGNISNKIIGIAFKKSMLM